MVEEMNTFQAVCARIRTLPAVALVALLLSGAAFAAGPILVAPDRRAIPQLVTREQTEIRYGTGVVVGAETILTARHAVSGTVEVVLPNAKVIGGVRCRAPDRDTAVISAKLPPGTPRYRISFRTLKVGETVRVGGYPDRRWTVVSGRVTNMIKSAVLSDRRVTTPMVVFKPALHQGASGSPVLDARGYVVGIFIASNAHEDYSIALPIATGLGPCRSIVQEGAAPVVPASSFLPLPSDVRVAPS
jgi:S1-C subfamily serine protease